VVVHHNGRGCDHFGRGSVRVVVGSDEGVGLLQPLQSGSGTERRHVRQWRRLRPSVQGGRRPGGVHMSAEGASEGEPMGGEGRRARRGLPPRGRGGQSGPTGLKAGIRPTQ
jgi:hypothetical protein